MQLTIQKHDFVFDTLEKDLQSWPHQLLSGFQMKSLSGKGVSR